MNIEEEFAKMQKWYDGSRKKKNATGKEAVLRFLLEHPERIWWWSWEFVGQTTKSGDFLSHRAPARASDLALQEPMMVEHRKIGRFACYRLRLENIVQIGYRISSGEPITDPQPRKIPIRFLKNGMPYTLIANTEQEALKILSVYPGAERI